MIRYLLILILLLNCTKVTIEQSVKKANYLKNEYYIKTDVWVRDWKGFAVTLEYSELKIVKKEDILRIKRIEYEKAFLTYTKVKAIIEDTKE